MAPQQSTPQPRRTRDEDDTFTASRMRKTLSLGVQEEHKNVAVPQLFYGYNDISWPAIEEYLKTEFPMWTAYNPIKVSMSITKS